MTYRAVLTTSVDSSNDILYNRMHLFHYYVNTVQYITDSVNTVQYITGVHLQYITVVPYLVRENCTVLTSVDRNDNLHRYIVQYITVVHYLVCKYCAVLTSVDSNDILYIVRKYCTVLTSVDRNDNLYRYIVQYITVVHYDSVM